MRAWMVGFAFCVIGQLMAQVSFDTSIRTVVSDYRSEMALFDGPWQVLKSLYEDYQPLSGAEYIIPKQVHFIWLGSPLPESCKEIVDSWKRCHPDWTVKVWTDNDVASFPFINRIAFDRAQNYGEKSDIWRYEILYQHGGVYADTDFECLRPFDDLHKSCEFYAGIGQMKEAELINALIGSRPNHPILRALIESVKPGPGDHDPWRIMAETGPYFFTKIFLDVAPGCPSGTVVPFPTTFFYPFPLTQRHRKDVMNIKREFARPESFAIHYFSTSWQK